ncbi:DegV family protein [Bacillus sp. SM2101]|uniref:DegV family protein n=1 Tax=Bacillus sp. SM2101 TaxID=2805366 RepID=UPI001BDDF5C6|nr:DegV family protein [Bacillus sp. SM2101]
MRKIKIVTDSTIDVSDEVLQKYGIEMVPLMITIEGKSFLDRIDISPSEFLNKMKQAAQLPKSSQPSTGQFVELYDRLDEEGYDVISIHMTGGMSGTVASAETAAEISKANVTVVDSRFLSKALSFQVLEAAKMASDGKSVDDIVNRLTEIRNNSFLYLTVDTLENLVKGGRIGKGKAFIGSLLNIKPISSLEGGSITPVGKVRSQSQIVKYLTKQFAKDVEGKVIKAVGIAHADARDLAGKLKEAISHASGYEEIEIVDTTPVISLHTGAGAMSIMYFAE